jgi:hypothetical protein
LQQTDTISGSMRVSASVALVHSTVIRSIFTSTSIMSAHRSMDSKGFSIFRIAHRIRAFTTAAGLCSYMLPSNSGDPQAITNNRQAFTNGTMADLVVTRNASGLFSAFVVGHGGFSVVDTNGATTFSGPDNIIYFFMDDFVSLTNYPNLPEAGTGFIDQIQVTAFPAAVPGPIVGAGLPGLILASAGLLAWWRRRKKTSFRGSVAGIARGRPPGKRGTLLGLDRGFFRCFLARAFYCLRRSVGRSPQLRRWRSNRRNGFQRPQKCSTCAPNAPR